MNKKQFFIRLHAENNLREFLMHTVDMAELAWDFNISDADLLRTALALYAN